ncbi:hypothetical protein P43SY_010447 [Pythium insidiosum]|uniref:Uncharacterized protein n=1 Tax=Pythium insidiosum TaxID=114742 RepID=A0AAD5Q4V9_PYTIN|nr:hypothetical protein P43SY_010447 [Pythium insidiosum]
MEDDPYPPPTPVTELVNTIPPRVDHSVLPARMLEALVMKNHLLKHLQVTRVGPASDVRDPGFNAMKDPALILWAIVGVFNTAGYRVTIRDREAILKYGKEALKSAGQAVYDLFLRHQMQRKIEQAMTKAAGGLADEEEVRRVAEQYIGKSKAEVTRMQEDIYLKDSIISGLERKADTTGPRLRVNWAKADPQDRLVNSAARLRASAVSDLKAFDGRHRDEFKGKAWLSSVRAAFRRDQFTDERLRQLQRHGGGATQHAHPKNGKDRGGSGGDDGGDRAIAMSPMSAASTTTMASSSATAMVASTTSEPRGEATKAQAETTETAAGAAVIDATASATSESEASSTRAAGNADNQDDSTGGDDNEHVARAQSMTSGSTAVTTAVSEASACADDGRVGTTAVDAVVHHDDDEGKAPVPKIAATSDASDVRSDQAASAPTETATAQAGVSTRRRRQCQRQFKRMWQTKLRRSRDAIVMVRASQSVMTSRTLHRDLASIEWTT